MLTFEKVLNVFADYLEQDAVVEIVMTRHGYTVLMWDRMQQNWWEAECCATPDKLLNVLLNSYEMYLEEKICGGKRELTAAEQDEIQQAMNKRKALFEQN